MKTEKVSFGGGRTRDRICLRRLALKRTHDIVSSSHSIREKAIYILVSATFNFVKYIWKIDNNVSNLMDL